MILHDRLVSDEVLGLARRDASGSRWARRPARTRCRRSGSTQLMLEHARAGRRVVRLKGGDPFVFGRGGEELEFLASPRHPVRSGAGHHRGACLRRVRGHSAHPPRARAVAAARHRALPRLARHARLGVARPGAPDAGLLHGRGGARHDRRRGCCGTGAMPRRRWRSSRTARAPDQRVTLATLAELEDLARRGDIESPALLIVGEVAALARAPALVRRAAAPLGSLRAWPDAIHHRVPREPRAAPGRAAHGLPRRSRRTARGRARENSDSCRRRSRRGRRSRGRARC